MTVPNTIVRNGPYYPNGVTTAFPFTFRAIEKDDVQVIRIDANGVETVVSNALFDVNLTANGGSAVFAAAPAAGDPLYVQLDPLFAQNISFENEGAFLPEVMTEALDRGAQRALYLRDQILRAPLLPLRGNASGQFPVVLPDGTWGYSSGTGADAGLRGDLAIDGGGLIGVRQAADLPVFSLNSLFRNGPVAVAHRFRKATDPDDTLALRRAIDTGFPVYMQAKMGSGANGRWRVKQQDATGATSLINRSGIELFGDGIGNTELEGTDDTYWVLHCSSNSSNNANNRRYLHFHDFSMIGKVDTQGFGEHAHLLSLSGVSNVIIERMAFIGFQGDGVYIGQGNIGGQEIHNERVTVRDCYFDGITNNNRNGVSFIDCITSLVEACTFVRCSRPGQNGYAYPTLPNGDIDFPAYYAQLAANKMNPNWGPGMPGPIDYEPDGNNAKIIDATVRGCIFWGCSGNVGAIGLQIPPNIPKGNIRGILWEGNFFQQNFQRGGAEMHVHVVRAVADPVVAADPPNQIVIRNNRGWGGYNAQAVINVFSAKDVLVEGNSFTDYVGGHIWGYVADSRSMKVFGLRVKGNRFTRCASTGNGVMNQVFDAEDVIFDGNIYDDCGSGNGFSCVWDFNTGTSKGVQILNNTITSATGKTAANAIVKEALHNYTRATNRLQGNTFGNRTAFFDAAQADIAQSYTPVLEGGSTVGAGTYSRQYGEYTQVGDWVQGFANVVASAHTGSGPIEIAVPVDPADLIGPDWVVSVVVETTGAGVPGAGKQVIGQVHGFASTTVGQGAIRLYTYDPATGVKAPLNMQNVAYTINCSFAYRAQVKP